MDFRGLWFTLALFTGLVAPSYAERPLSLMELYTQALEEDPRVNIAQQRLEQSRAQHDVARGALLPQASAFAQYSANEVNFDDPLQPRQSYGGERYVVQVRQMLFNWRSISARARASNVIDQREAELMDVMSELSVNLAQRYFNVLLADDNVELLEAELELLSQQVKETDALFERRLVALTDQLEVRARADQVRIDLIDAKNNAALAREELTALVGIDAASMRELGSLRDDYTLPSLQKSSEQWVRDALANNALLASRREAVQAARKTIDEQRGAYMPTVDLVMNAQRSDIGFDNLQLPGRENQYIGVDINLPLFAGGANRARVREAQSGYRIALEEEEATRREVVKRVRGAWLTSQANLQRIEAAKLSLESAVTRYEAARKSFSIGVAKAADVIAALHFRTRAERDYKQALYSYFVGWLELYHQGGAMDPDYLQQLELDVIASGA
jgi:outer membrane protein